MEYTERTKAEQIANAYFDMGADWSASGGLLKELREMEDGYIKQLADAQATIAALHARVKELEDDRSAWKEIAQDWSAAAKLAEQPEKFYEGYSAAVMNAMQALLTKARAELTQRTAELEAAKRQIGEEQKRLLVVCDQRNDARAELERVRALIKALPKVEGAVVVSNGYVKDSTRCHALFGADEDAALYAALLQHRQGMEG